MSPESFAGSEKVAELAIDWQQPDEIDVDVTTLKQAVHLWTLDLGSLDIETLSNKATKKESVRAERIRDLEKRQLYLGGRVGLRHLLCKYTGLEDRDLRIGYGDRGKPRLENTPFDGELTFNYTLSQDKVLYALAVDRALGVDLEKLPREINAELMARSKLATTERNAWMRVAESEKQNAMLSCWTRKEAYGKVIGVGIRYFLNQVVLFTELGQPRFQTVRTGLFENTSQSAMPKLIEGVQIALPFDGVASLMYQRHSGTELSLPIVAAHLKI